MSNPIKTFFHLNQSHFLTIRLGLNHNSMVSLQDDPIWSNEGRNCIQKVLYSEPTDPLTYTQSACSQPHKVPVPMAL